MPMLRLLANASRILSRYTSLFIIATAVLAAAFPMLFSWVGGIYTNIILGLIMLTMGCTLGPQDFRILLLRPWDILVGSLAQFTIMPLVAWSLTRIFHLDPYVAAGVILVGCCPGGVSSNIMSYLCRGDVAYSVGMTTVSTLLAPFVTPLLMLWLAGQSINVDVWSMFCTIAMVTLIPVSLGTLFNYAFGGSRHFRDMQSIMPGLSVLCLALIVGGVVVGAKRNMPDNYASVLMQTLLVVTLHNGLGYLLGYVVGWIFRFSTPKRRTISIEVGMQNAGMATGLAQTCLLAVNPLAAMSVVPCAISCAYHSISGTLLAGLFTLWDKRKSPTDAVAAR